jgi:hypothetical protein
VPQVIFVAEVYDSLLLGLVIAVDIWCVSQWGLFSAFPLSSKTAMGGWSLASSPTTVLAKVSSDQGLSEALPFMLVVDGGGSR